MKICTIILDVCSIVSYNVESVLIESELFFSDSLVSIGSLFLQSISAVGKSLELDILIDSCPCDSVLTVSGLALCIGIKIGLDAFAELCALFAGICQS